MTEMVVSNRITRSIDKLNKFPVWLRAKLLNMSLTRVVPYLQTSGVVFEKVTAEEVIVSVENKKKVQNHIQGVHALAMALLAETSTGFVLSMNLPDDKLPLIKTMTIHYKRRTKGDLRAVASLTSEQRAQVQAEPKGEILVPVVVTDESGEEPIQCEMLWAWIPKK